MREDAEYCDHVAHLFNLYGAVFFVVAYNLAAILIFVVSSVLYGDVDVYAAFSN